MNSIVLEICVDSVESAHSAEAGGADRIELCRALDEGGLTPSEELLRSVRAAIELDVFVMIRPRAGSFVYSPAELDWMRAEIERAGALGADGVVLGALTPDGEVDVAAVRTLVAAARPMQVTFHRAFDVSVNLDTSLEQVIVAGADRILTSAAGKTARQAADRIAQLVRAADGRIIIMAGGGIRCANVRDLVLAAEVREVHTSLGFGDGDGVLVTGEDSLQETPGHHRSRFIVREANVRAMRETLEELTTLKGMQAPVR
jgi:copper homeostasis protein